jgi:hypothetical protein
MSLKHSGSRRLGKLVRKTPIETFSSAALLSIPLRPLVCRMGRMGIDFLNQ